MIPTFELKFFRPCSDSPSPIKNKNQYQNWQVFLYLIFKNQYIKIFSKIKTLKNTEKSICPYFIFNVYFHEHFIKSISSKQFSDQFWNQHNLTSSQQLILESSGAQCRRVQSRQAAGDCGRRCPQTHSFTWRISECSSSPQPVASYIVWSSISTFKWKTN